MPRRVVSEMCRRDRYELAVKKGDEIKKGQHLFKYNDPAAKQGVTEAEMQKKIAQKVVTLFQKQIDAAKQKLQKDTNLTLIHISDPTSLGMISYSFFCLPPTHI